MKENKRIYSTFNGNIKQYKVKEYLDNYEIIYIFVESKAIFINQLKLLPYEKELFDATTCSNVYTCCMRF